MKRRLVLGAAGAAVVTGCAAPQLADYAGALPRLDLREYFSGTVDAWGIFTDRGGKVVLRDQRIGVSLICPGFVATRLTAQNQFAMPALITPEQSAKAILDGWAEGRFQIHFPRRFTLAMKLLRLLPFRLYRGVVRRFTGL